LKIKIVEDKTMNENELTIHCKAMTPELESLIQELQTKTILAYKHSREVLINIQDVIFFETDQETVYVHTAKELFETRQRLYELEVLLPNYFMRISKSGIVNLKKIESIEKALTSSRTIHILNSHKVIYVSRKYYPVLKSKLNERSFNS
jgi:DNA-binding LytR/AlgR family response regulator